MTSTSTPGSRRAAPREAARTSRWTARAIIGSFFLWTSGIHVGVAAINPSSYRHFADAAIMAWVERGWNEVFMANPRAWGLAVASGELILGLLLLRGGGAAKVGWLGVIGFHFLLVLFGWGFLIWSAPALAVLVVLTRRDWPRLTTPPAAQPARRSGTPAVRGERADWAEFVAEAVPGAEANVGGTEQARSGRPGSHEADGVRNLPTGTVGHDEPPLLQQRTEPLTVRVFVDEILVDLGEAYHAAQREIARRHPIGLPISTTDSGGVVLGPGTDDQQRQADELAELQNRLERQRARDWAEYGQALTANVGAAAARLPGLAGLAVPVVVTVDRHTFRPDAQRQNHTKGVAQRVLQQALEATPLPGNGRAPLDRLHDTTPAGGGI